MWNNCHKKVNVVCINLFPQSEEKATLPSHPQNSRSSLLKKVAAFSRRALTQSKEVKQVKPKDPLAAVMMEDDSTKEPGEDTNQNKHIEMVCMSRTFEDCIACAPAAIALWFSSYIVQISTFNPGTINIPNSNHNSAQQNAHFKV